MARLVDELGKRDPFETLEQEAVLNVLRTADRMLRDVEALLKPHGLSAAGYNVLRILRGHGTPVPCREIASRMVSREPDMTRLLDRLDKLGLVTRNRAAGDRRVVLTHLTPAGNALLAQLDEPVRRTHRSQLAHMGADKLRQLIDLLEQARTPTEAARSQ